VVIRQYIEALKAVAGDRLDPEMTGIIERCGSRLHALETLVENWLDISRIGEGSFVWKKTPLDLLELIGRSVEETAPLCRAKSISVNTDLPDRLPEILGDSESLLRVLTNIIGNAVKYTPEKGTITLAAAYDDYYVTLRISDTGAGIPADKLPFVFEPFYRVKGKEESQRGSGLGLTFCKRIMELHGGEIAAASTEGQGSTFQLKFLTHVRPESATGSRIPSLQSF
jgi:signal transduction histidine kinase